MPWVEAPEPSRVGEVVWLEPYPDTLLDGAPLGPEARYEQSEAISLTFVTALQLLPPRQLAVLILRDVLGYRAVEVADLLDTTVDSVNSALKRARAGLRLRERAPAANPVAEQALVAEFARAYSSGDIDSLVTLLTDDVFMSMPPVPFEYHGLEAVRRFYTSVISHRRTYHFVPTRANGQPAFGAYLRSASGVRHGAGLLVLTLDGDRICAITRFDDSVLPSFGLPLSLPG